MKQILVFLTLIVLIVSCTPQPRTTNLPVIDGEYHLIVIDSCEYVMFENGQPNNYNYGLSITHKGNCKYCTARK